MKGIYPVFFTKADDDTILIEVPDLEILTEGRDMADAIKMARDAIELKIVCLEDDEEAIPNPTAFSELDITKGTFYGEGESVNSVVDFDSDTYRKKIENKRVRRNVSLPSWLNVAADEAGINVSRVLQEALKAELGL